MKILVTGGLGFIGSALVRRAVYCGHSVMNVDAMTYAATSQSVSSVSASHNYFFERGDIRDGKFLDKIFLEFKPDVVMHLAAESHVDNSINDPSDFISTNVVGTYTLLQSALNYWVVNKKFDQFRFHHISTDEVFGTLPLGSTSKFSEATPYAPRSPYSASKASADHLVRAWHHTFGMPVLITNCSNNYGPFHFPEKFIPVIINSALNNQPIPLYGDGLNVRDWLFVEDHAIALLKVVQDGVVGETYNIGGNSEASNIEIVKSVCGILDRLVPRLEGSYRDLIEFVPDRPGHDRRYAVDTKKIFTELKWEPATNLMDGLEFTVNWYLENEDWWRPLLNAVDVKFRSGNPAK